jgi:TorA maturation chaperone TorD
VLGISARDETLASPEDGIGFLCEVMAGMALKRFDAPANEFERAFFSRHLAPWAERFFTISKRRRRRGSTARSAGSAAFHGA